MARNKEVGKQGEEIACEYLTKLGYKILERNKHFSKSCELDIIALDKAKTLVAVEVKTRTSDICGLPTEAITRTKYNNIKSGLFYYLKENPSYKNYRIDVISIILTPSVNIQHLKNV